MKSLKNNNYLPEIKLRIFTSCQFFFSAFIFYVRLIGVMYCAYYTSSYTLYHLHCPADNNFTVWSSKRKYEQYRDLGSIPTGIEIVLVCVFVPPSSDDSITHSHSATLTRIPPNCENSETWKDKNWHGINKNTVSSAENYSGPG